MLYCEKCRSLCQDTTRKCPNCKSSKLRVAEETDLVLLHRADQYTASRLAEQFDEMGIVYEIAPFASRSSQYLYDSEVMPTDKNIFVRVKDLQAAEELSVRMKEELERVQEQEEEEFEDMPRKKRILVQVVSLLLFFLLITLAVLGADAVGQWLRAFFV